MPAWQPPATYTVTCADTRSNHNHRAPRSICGLCVRYRGTGSGAGGNPIAGDWQPGFICDEVRTAFEFMMQ